jgi:hypothetical protein
MADDETPGWSQPEYSPGANPHNDGSDHPPGLPPEEGKGKKARAKAEPPAGAQTGNEATDRGGAASGAGAGSDDEAADLAHKAEQAERVHGAGTRAVAETQQATAAAAKAEPGQARPRTGRGT